MLLKIGAPKNFENLIGRTPALESLFKKAAGPEALRTEALRNIPYAQQISDHLQLSQ